MDLKPDLGLFYQRNGFDPADSIFFYEVELREIAFLSKANFSAMYEIAAGDDGQIFAMSLDFGPEIMGLLLRRLAPGVAGAGDPRKSGGKKWRSGSAGVLATAWLSVWLQNGGVESSSSAEGSRVTGAGPARIES